MGGVEIQDFGLLNEDNDGDGNETEVEEVGDNNEENTYDVRFDQVLEAEEGLADVPEFFFEDVEGSDEEDNLVEVDTYNQVYANIIHPVPGPHDFVRTPYVQLLPSTVKRAPGRPKTKRRKTPEEHEDEKKSTRRGLTLHCSICGDGGHNKRSCKATRNAPKQSNQAQPGQGSNQHNQFTVASSPPTQESQISRLTNQVQTLVVTSVVYPSHTSMKCMHILQPVSKPPKTTKRVAPLNAKKGTASTSRGRIHNSSRSNALTTCLPSTHLG
ncbi:hypothetical protein DM860_008654 [Cuscuta australis]|uniref:CCHC-type domain-containing protein n=1 Tax=Cuscuta australis TaxID=267555 RepID=A0A328D5X6_9ASTE|nr:hypothetical protein DM860_008654 [Cuscuta australis]